MSDNIRRNKDSDSKNIGDELLEDDLELEADVEDLPV